MSEATRNNHTKHWIRADKRLAIYLRDNFVCGYCGIDLRLSPPNMVTLDHLIPRSSPDGFGTNEPHNLTTACLSCNSSRQDKPWMDYATSGAVERIQTRRSQSLNMVLARAILDGTVGDEEVESLR